MTDAGSALLLACLRPPETRDPSSIREHAGRIRDWTPLFDRAEWHGVSALIMDALEQAEAEVPRDTQTRARTRLTEQAARSLHLASITQHLTGELEARGIQAVPFKGPFLGHLLYGNLGARRSLDVDLLVAPRDALVARRILEQAGLRFWLDLAPWQERRFLGYSNEYGLRTADGTIVELAWAFAPRYMGVALPMEEMLARALPVRIEGRAVRSLETEDLLVALAVHGGKHGWDRLLWVADLARLLANERGLDWTRVASIARRGRVLRMVATAVDLAVDLLSAPIPDGAAQDLVVDPQASRLAASSARRLTGPGIPRAGRLLPDLRSNPRDGLTDRLREIVQLAVTPTVEDWQFVPLPGSMAWAYPAIRPFRLASKYVLRSEG